MRRRRSRVLEVRGLEVSYGDVQAVFDVSLDVAEGEIVTLLGSNGAGKTTTLRAIAGLRRAGGGEISFDGRSLLSTAGSGRAELGIGLVPEGRDLWPQLTVEENLRLGAYSRRARPHVQATIRQLHQDGLTVLLVEQNLNAALEIADRGYVVETGRVKLHGTSAELLANAEIRAAYLGV